MSKKKEVNKYSWDYITGEKYWSIIDILQSNEDDITKQAELVAVIAAAIAASEGTSTSGFVVRSINRR